MSDVGPAPHDPRRLVTVRRVLLVAVIVVVFAAGALAEALIGDADHAGAAKGWDPRVLPIARFVEKERGLTFTHPVAVRFLDDAAFDKALGPSSGAFGAASDTQEAALLRALGLGAGQIDLGTSGSPKDDADTVGFYDDATKQLSVRGTSLTPYVRVTVAHELTHALQDQRLGLSELDKRPDDQQQAISALVEGDAVSVEHDYEATFDKADQATYDQEAAQGSTGGGSDQPAFLGDQGGFPYDLGPTFVDALLAHGGNAALDAAFADPPTTEAQIADPSLYLAHVGPAAVPPPALPAGATPLVDLGAFGQVSLADVLGTKLGYGAWAAVQGWRGDHARLYSTGGRTCVALAVATRQPASLATAASAWAVSLVPATGVTVTGGTASGGVSAAATAPPAGEVEITSCDPGPDITLAAPATPSAYDGITARANVLDDIEGFDSPPAQPVAECAADRTVAALGLGAAIAYDTDSSGAPSSDQVDADEKAAVSACGPTATG